MNVPSKPPTPPPKTPVQIIEFCGNIDALQEFFEHVIDIANEHVCSSDWTTRGEQDVLILYLRVIKNNPEYLFDLLCEEIEKIWSNEITTIEKKGEKTCQAKN